MEGLGHRTSHKDHCIYELVYHMTHFWPGNVLGELAMEQFHAKTGMRYGNLKAFLVIMF